MFFGALFPIPLTLPWIVTFCYYFCFLFITLSSSLRCSIFVLFSVTRLFNFPLPWFLICLNGCCYCSLTNWTIYQVLPQQNLSCLFVNWLLPFEAVDICKENFCRAGFLPSFTLLSSPTLCCPSFLIFTAVVQMCLAMKGLLLQLLDLDFIYLFIYIYIYIFMLNVKHKCSCHSFPSWLVNMILVHKYTFSDRKSSAQFRYLSSPHLLW